MPVVKAFVERVGRGSKMLEYKKSLFRGALSLVGPALNYFVKDSMAEFATGLDHDIPFLPRL